MSPEEAVRALDALSRDPESDHFDADEILLSLLDELAPAVSEAWRRAEERDDGWWWA